MLQTCVSGHGIVLDWWCFHHDFCSDNSWCWLLDSFASCCGWCVLTRLQRLKWFDLLFSLPLLSLTLRANKTVLVSTVAVADGCWICWKSKHLAINAETHESGNFCVEVVRRHVNKNHARTHHLQHRPPNPCHSPFNNTSIKPTQEFVNFLSGDIV